MELYFKFGCTNAAYKVFIIYESCCSSEDVVDQELLLCVTKLVKLSSLPENVFKIKNNANYLYSALPINKICT